MRKRALTMVGLTVLAVTAFGQDVQQRRGGRGRQDGQRGRGPSIARMVERMAQDLNFDEDQMAQLDGVIKAQEERMADMRAKWEEVRAATESGDEERAAQLREELQQERGGRGGMMQALFDDIEPLLHEDQVEAFQQMRERMSQQRGGPGGRGGMRQIVRDLPDAVNMTEEQRAKFQEILTERREMMRERMQERRQSGDGAEREPGERQGPPDFAAMQDEFFAQVAEILTEDQQKLLADYRQQLESERADSQSQGASNVRTVLAAAKRVRDLSKEQKDSLREIERDAMRSSRDLRRTDREGQALLAADVKARIVKLLDEKQGDEFQQNLDRLQSRGGRGDRGAGNRQPRERRGRDRQDQP